MQNPFKRLGEPDGFEIWQKKFKADNEDDFVFLDETIMEYMDIEEEQCEPLRYHICRACFDATNFQDLSADILREERDAVAEINNAEGRSPIKAIDELLKFCKDYPGAAEKIAGYWLPEAYGGHPDLPRRLAGKPPLEMLKGDLEKMKWGFGFYSKKHYEHPHYPIQSGPLSFPREEGKRTRLRDNPAVDGLIFEMALLIRCFLHGLPIDTLHRPMELPERKRLNAAPELITRFVNAALDKDFPLEKIVERLDSLRKGKAKWVGWDQRRAAPKAPAPAPASSNGEEPLTMPALFSKK
ncbi:MAG: hypothetical protein ACYCXJ_06990 [Thermoleophilia bacterium]